MRAVCGTISAELPARAATSAGELLYTVCSEPAPIGIEQSRTTPTRRIETTDDSASLEGAELL